MIRKILRRLLGGVITPFWRIQFRLRNKHNKVVPGAKFPLKCVTIGQGTYGRLNLIWISPDTTRVSIGNYVSIGPNVEFLVGGEHNYHRLSTYPFQSFIYKQATKDIVCRDIIIEDDVWIGYGALIMSGVKIGKGSVIGARSVVAKDVPPYSIFVGNKVIKKRFSDVVIDRLLRIDFSAVSHQTGDAYAAHCQDELTDDNANDLIRLFTMK